MRPPDFWDHVREAVASYKRMAGTMGVEDLRAVLDAVYADREEAGLPCEPRAAIDLLIVAGMAKR